MSDASESSSPQDLKSKIKQLTQPLVDSLDARLSTQVDRRVDQRIEDTVKDRLAVLERAVADLDRTVHELQQRLGDETPL